MIDITLRNHTSSTPSFEVACNHGWYGLSENSYSTWNPGGNPLTSGLRYRKRSSNTNEALLTIQSKVHIPCPLAVVTKGVISTTTTTTTTTCTFNALTSNVTCLAAAVAFLGTSESTTTTIVGLLSAITRLQMKYWPTCSSLERVSEHLQYDLPGRTCSKTWLWPLEYNHGKRDLLHHLQNCSTCI